MADYPINKGIGKPVEFKGLKSQYLFIFAGGLLALFVLFIIMYMVGINQWVCIIFGVTSATLLVWLTFRLNEKYGTHGLMKLSARKLPFPYHQPKSHIPIIPFKTSIEMRNILKATTLENKFPLFTVENGCIVSKDADITVAFRWNCRNCSPSRQPNTKRYIPLGTRR